MHLYISPIQPQNEANTGLIIAALYGNSEVVHLLLVSGADPNIQNAVSGVRVGNGTVECESVHHMSVTLTTDHRDEVRGPVVGSHLCSSSQSLE